jgi:hypothetical protein
MGNTVQWLKELLHDGRTYAHCNLVSEGDMNKKLFFEIFGGCTRILDTRMLDDWDMNAYEHDTRLKSVEML